MVFLVFVILIYRKDSGFVIYVAPCEQKDYLFILFVGDYFPAVYYRWYVKIYLCDGFVALLFGMLGFSVHKRVF